MDANADQHIGVLKINRFLVSFLVNLTFALVKLTNPHTVLISLSPRIVLYFLFLLPSSAYELLFSPHLLTVAFLPNIPNPGETAPYELYGCVAIRPKKFCCFRKRGQKWGR